MHDEPQSRRDSPSNGKLVVAIENCAEQFNQLIRKLQAAGFSDCAEALSKKLDDFDSKCSSLHADSTATPRDRRAVKDNFDASCTALAGMHKVVWKTVAKECSFAEHHDLLKGIRGITNAVQKDIVPRLKEMGLEYYEFSSLHLELEAKLGLETPIELAKPEPRRRRQPKDPVKLESALRDCLETTIDIRRHITNEDKQEHFDKIIRRVTSALNGLPEIPALPDDPTGADIEARDEARGDRIAKLLSASAQALKVSKWVRKVDLFETEPSASKRDEILRRFDVLDALAKGQDPTTARY